MGELKRYQTINNWDIKKVTVRELIKMIPTHADYHPPIWVMENLGDLPQPFNTIYAWLQDQKGNKKVYLCEHMGGTSTYKPCGGG